MRPNGMKMPREMSGIVLLLLLFAVHDAASSVCSPADFRCNNMRCLSIYKKCNRENDCGDNSDELNCAPVNISLAVVWTTTQKLSGRSSLYKLFGDPDFYLPKFASNISNDLGLSVDGINSDNPESHLRTLAFAYGQHSLFFADSGSSPSLNYGLLIYNNHTTSYRFNPTKISDQTRGLSVDWISNTLYWIDGHYKRISAVSLNLIVIWRPIVETNLDSPQDVAVHAQAGYLFWSDSGPNPRIERSRLDGQNRTVLVNSSRLVTPTTLVIDVGSNKLYWLDTGASSLGSVNCDGSNVSVWRHSALSTAAGFAMYKGYIFVGDKTEPKFTIFKILSTGLSIYTTIPFANINGVVDMTFFSPTSQPNALSACTLGNGGCSHFCFTVPPFSRSCQCSIGFVPSPGNVNCTIQPFNENYIIVADTLQRNVFQIRQDTGEVRALLPLGDRFPTAVDFDFVHKYVYWVDNKTNGIGKASLDGRLNVYIYQYTSSASSISGIAVDVARELLYCTDPSLGRIVRMSTLGTDTRLIYTDLSTSPKSIVIDVNTRRLYWSDCGRNPSIRSARTTDDGLEDRSVLVQQNIGCASLAIDPERHLLFWSDNSNGQVWKIGTDGSGRTLLYTESRMSSGATTNIAVTSDAIFVTNSKLQWVTKIDRNTSVATQQKPLDLFYSPAGVATSDSTYRYPDTFEDNFLVVADAYEQRRNLYQIDIDSGTMIPLLTTRPINPVALVFDPDTKVLFWTDVVQGLIGRFSMSGKRGNWTVVFQDTNGGSVLDGLALDTVRRKLYYADAGSIPKIVEMNEDGSQAVIVVTGNGIKPRALVIDEENRYLYCTDWGDLSGIYRITLGTNQRRLLVSDNIVWPNALAIDFQERMMYWADAIVDRIEMANLDGSGRVTLIIETNAHYFAITLSPQYIYITDWIYGAVRRLNRRTRQLSVQEPRIFGKLFDVIYYNSTAHRDKGTRPPAETTPIPTRAPISTSTSPPTESTSVIFDINKTFPPAIGDKVSGKQAPPISSAVPPNSVDSTTVIGDKTVKPLPDKHKKGSQIDHTMVIVIALLVGGVVLVTAMITLGVCCVAKRRKARPTPNINSVPNRRVPSYSTSHGERSANTYDTSGQEGGGLDSSRDGGFLNPAAESFTSFHEDYLKPVGAYYSIKDEAEKFDLIFGSDCNKDNNKYGDA